VAILNDSEIARLCMDKAMIEPWAPHRGHGISHGVSSFGYDMRVADEWTWYKHGVLLDPKHVTEAQVHRAHADSIMMEPGEFVLCRSVEHFIIPDDVMVVVLGKSTYARCGIIVNVTPLEPGWRGHVTIELSNTNTVPVRVYANEGIAQCLFFRGERPVITYADRSGKYQGQHGVTLPRSGE
jgi:dCTP deaminase